MHRLIQHFTLFALLMVAPSIAEAQRVPATDSGAVGGDVGIFLPRDEALDSSLALEGFYEYYFAPRTSMRLGLGWTSPGFDRESDDSLRMVRVAVDGVYNWEGGTVHPFVGAGLGIYFLQPIDNGESIEDSETKAGLSLFGGIELFSNRTTSVKAEARYHIIPNALGLNPDGLALTIGLKKYF